jgi:hypothetical protein
MPMERHNWYSSYLLKLYRITIRASITDCLPYLENICLFGFSALHLKPLSSTADAIGSPSF